MTRIMISPREWNELLWCDIEHWVELAFIGRKNNLSFQFSLLGNKIFIYIISVKHFLSVLSIDLAGNLSRRKREKDEKKNYFKIKFQDEEMMKSKQKASDLHNHQKTIEEKQLPKGKRTEKGKYFLSSFFFFCRRSFYHLVFSSFFIHSQNTQVVSFFTHMLWWLENIFSIVF